jgi:hypothetical protein
MGSSRIVFIIAATLATLWTGSAIAQVPTGGVEVAKCQNLSSPWEIGSKCKSIRVFVQIPADGWASLASVIEYAAWVEAGSPTFIRMFSTGYEIISITGTRDGKLNIHALAWYWEWNPDAK